MVLCSLQLPSPEIKIYEHLLVLDVIVKSLTSFLLKEKRNSTQVKVLPYTGSGVISDW